MAVQSMPREDGTTLKPDHECCPCNERLRAEMVMLRGVAYEVHKLARQVRAAQKRYFKDRTQSALTESKRLEKELDELLAAYQP